VHLFGEVTPTHWHDRLVNESTVQIILTSIGVVGTLAAALLTQVLAQRAEAARRAAEDRSRWLVDRLRLNARFLAESLSLERELWSAAAHLDPDERAIRMPGYTSILLTPDDGLPGVFDKTTREILVEVIEDAFERLNHLEETAAEIALVGTADEVSTARALHEALWDVVGWLETYAPFDVVADNVEHCRAARDAFAQAARAGLRTDGQICRLDRRPRSEGGRGA